MADDATLRRAYAARAAASPSKHPDEAAWERVACGEMDPAERERTLDHIARCAECAQVWRALSQLRREARSFDAGMLRAEGSGRRAIVVPWILSGLAAAAAVAAVSVMLMPAARPPSPAPSEATRSGSDTNRPRPLSPIGLVVAPTEFRWEAVAGARAYRVRLFRDEVLLWSSGETARTSLAWPASLQLQPGRYFWQVVAIPSWSRGDADQIASEPALLEVGSGR